jgi:uncharacterized SAM-binding protein YcdF (DUF218 family)
MRAVLRLALRLAALAVVLLLVYLGVTFVQVWHTSRQDEAAAAGRADAIVVMGAAQYSGRPSPVFRARLDHAADLYHRGIAERVVLTGGGVAGDRTEASVGEGYLLGRGVPEADMLLETQGKTSWQSLAAAARILRQRELTTVVLVTDPYHALRVAAIADELGLDPFVSPRQGPGSLRRLLRETVAVSVGRVIGFGRLERVDQVRGRLERR